MGQTGRVVSGGGKVKAKTGRNVATAGKGKIGVGGNVKKVKGSAGKTASAVAGNGGVRGRVAAPAMSARLTRVATQKAARMAKASKRSGY